MGDTTQMLRAKPESQTHWHAIAAAAHRRRGQAGDEASAKSHEQSILEIRLTREAGNSRKVRYCPKCLARGHRYVLLWGGPAPDWCGTCYWPRPIGPDSEPAPDA